MNYLFAIFAHLIFYGMRLVKSNTLWFATIVLITAYALVGTI